MKDDAQGLQKNKLKRLKSNKKIIVRHNFKYLWHCLDLQWNRTIGNFH